MDEKRKGIEPVPSDPQEYMNEAQLVTLRRVQDYGWHIEFIRHPLYERPVCVVADPEEATFVVIEEDGTLNKDFDISLRSEVTS